MDNQVLRIPRKLKEFVYEGITFGVKPATTRQAQEIARLISEFNRTVKKELKADTADGIAKDSTQQGDLGIILQAQTYVCEHLVVDPKTGRNIFGEGGENIQDLPGDFAREAWFCHTGQTTKYYPAISLVDVLGEPFVRKYAFVDSDRVNAEIRRLDEADPPAARTARAKLDLKKAVATTEAVESGEVSTEEEDPTQHSETFHSVGT